MTNGPIAHPEWPTPQPIRGVIFDIHSTLVDQGDAESWLDAALVVEPHPLTTHERAELIAFLDRIWEGARTSDPQSSLRGSLTGLPRAHSGRTRSRSRLGQRAL
ncbi:MAG: hypothetical protein O2789_04975 [Actinomycetota bacterium]|nr:hypothetical protein [Actinomycetota bacterium]